MTNSKAVHWSTSLVNFKPQLNFILPLPELPKKASRPLLRRGENTRLNH